MYFIPVVQFEFTEYKNMNKKVQKKLTKKQIEIEMLRAADLNLEINDLDKERREKAQECAAIEDQLFEFLEVGFYMVDGYELQSSPSGVKHCGREYKKL